MRRGSWTLLVGWALAASVATPAAGEPRLDAGLRAAAALVKARVRAGAPGGPAASHESLPPDGRIEVSVWRPDGLDALVAAGFAVRPATAEIGHVRLDPAELPRLAAVPGVLSIEPARELHLLLDRSAPLVGALAARARLGLDGRGVVIAVIDTGADVRHRDLRRADGSTRIAALLDVGARRDDRHPELPDYGGAALWLADEIDAQLAAEAAGQTPAVPVTQVDTNGHGTHVAGIAAGGGLATGQGLAAQRYVGIAPAATLLIAKAARGGSFTESDLLASLRFVLDQSASLAAPVVINLSLGSELGPHDGTTNLERAISQLVPLDAPGRAVVVAAGNTGARGQHAGGWSLDGSVEIGVAVPRAIARDASLTIDLWTDAGPAAPAITLIAPDGERFGPVALGDSLDTGSQARAGRVMIGNQVLFDPVNRRHQSSVTVAPSDGRAVASGSWRLVLRGRVRRWDGWIDTPAAGGSPRFLDHLDDDVTAGLPATAASAISVGSVVSRRDWPRIDGRIETRPLIVADPSTFSSAGPSIDGRFVPDLVAPGQYILSALSRDALPSQPQSAFARSDPNEAWADDGVHGVLQGTSQAAPHVAGAIALLFQIDPRLTPRALRELLRTSARPLPGTPGYSPRLGFGLLDIERAADLTAGRRGAAVDPVTSTVGTSRSYLPPVGLAVVVSVVPRDAAGAPLGPGHDVRIEASAGRFGGPVRDLGFGRYERTLLAQGRERVTATINVWVDGVPLQAHPGIFFSSEPAGSISSGGCSLTPARGDASSSAALSALLFLVVRRFLARPRRRATRSAPRGSVHARIAALSQRR